MTFYLTYAEKKGLGTADLENIEIIGKQIEEVFYGAHPIKGEPT